MAREIGKSNLKDQIDANLRRAFDDVLNESVPDRFQELLERLKDRKDDDDAPRS